jgi:hypothetical protein
MPKFRKQPVTISAERWYPGKHIEGVIEITNNIGQIKTLEGWVTCRPGDWIITGVCGEKYPCRDDIFRKTYEPIDNKGSQALED